MKKRFFIFLLAVMLLCCNAFSGVRETSADTALTITGVDQVLIYNPLIWIEKEQPAELSSGTLTGLISTSGSSQTEETESILKDFHYSQQRYFESAGNRLSGFSLKEYAVGDTRTFCVCTNLNTDAYSIRSFTLLAAGEHCYIWSYRSDSNAITADKAQALADTFDGEVYDSDSKYFGAFRDLEKNGKLNVITYKMNVSVVCGFFDSNDLYSYEEMLRLDPNNITEYNFSPIIYLNTTLPSYFNSTLAHEFQHLINFSADMASPANGSHLGNEYGMGVWLDEGFAMEAEELCWPGSVVEQGYVSGDYNRSGLIRAGQSLYNFSTGSNDVGVYGQSFLFAEYLKDQGGVEVFLSALNTVSSATNVNSLSDGAILHAVLPDYLCDAADDLVTYTDAVTASFADDNEELLSKLNLAFHIAVLAKEDSGIFAISGGADSASSPIYTGSKASIQGGGAILVNVTSNSFTPPNDADAGLVYVGLKDGKIVSVNGTAYEPFHTGWLYGDADMDGEITARDAALILRHTVKLITLNASARYLSDTDKTKTVNAADATNVLRNVVGLALIPQD